MAFGVERVGGQTVLVGEGTEGVGAEVDEGFHVLLCEPGRGCCPRVSAGLLLGIRTNSGFFCLKGTHRLCPGGTWRCGGICRTSWACGPFS